MEEYRDFIEVFGELWHKGLQDPQQTQAQTLEWLVEGYARTVYGQQWGAADLPALAEDPPRFFDAYRRAFPVATYDDLKPWIDRVIAGEVEALLPEPPVAWAMTRGTTRGTPKRIPIT
ncbi:MAG: hypothetical protein GWN58_03635 [Anaerolineae bacterium]|nr:hypothetical protein [Anaerolineae bacterium]